MWPNDLVTFTEEIFNGKLLLLYSDNIDLFSEPSNCAEIRLNLFFPKIEINRIIITTLFSVEFSKTITINVKLIITSTVYNF